MGRLKKIIILIFGKGLVYKFSRHAYRLFHYRQIPYLLYRVKLFLYIWKNKTRYKKDIVNQPLILISQIQRSGGSLLSQLFDNHSEILAYFGELIVFSPKYKWGDLPENFDGIFNDYVRHAAIKGRYSKETKAPWDESYQFIFSLEHQKIQYNSSINAMKKTPVRERKKFDAYFTSFFNSFLNYKVKENIASKKFVTAFIPRLNMVDNSLKKYFGAYPDGYLITIVRRPSSWLASAQKHATDYNDTAEALRLWLQSTKQSIKLSEQNDRVIPVVFEELIGNTEGTMKNICSTVGIMYESSLISPSFNGDLILSDSSFKAKKGIDKNVLDRIPVGYDESNVKDLVVECENEYSKFKRIADNYFEAKNE